MAGRQGHHCVLLAIVVGGLAAAAGGGGGEGGAGPGADVHLLLGAQHLSLLTCVGLAVALTMHLLPAWDTKIQCLSGN